MAISNAAFGDFAGAASDLFAADADRTKGQALRLKAQGDELEAENYGRAAVLAGQNEQFTETSTAIKQAQIDRSTTLQIGTQQNAIAGGGFKNSGSALDILHDSASQGAITKAVAGEQGLITEAGYKEQQQSFLTMQQAAYLAAEADRKSADAADEAARGSTITGAFKFGAGLALLAVAPEAAPLAAPETMGLDGLEAIH